MGVSTLSASAEPFNPDRAPNAVISVRVPIALWTRAAERPGALFIRLTITGKPKRCIP